MTEKFEKWESEKDGLWYFHLKAPNGEVIATSEGYTSEQNCDEGIESVMVNCNPETVSTDYDTSNKLYFEPLTVEDVLSIYEKEKPEGAIVQFGGQTPLNIAQELADAGVKILGTSTKSIALAEDREKFNKIVAKPLIRPEAVVAFVAKAGIKKEAYSAERTPAV